MFLNYSKTLYFAIALVVAGRCCCSVRVRQTIRSDIIHLRKEYGMHYKHVMLAVCIHDFTFSCAVCAVHTWHWYRMDWIARKTIPHPRAHSFHNNRLIYLSIDAKLMPCRNGGQNGKSMNKNIHTLRMGASTVPSRHGCVSSISILQWNVTEFTYHHCNNENCRSKCTDSDVCVVQSNRCSLWNDRTETWLTERARMGCCRIVRQYFIVAHHRVHDELIWSGGAKIAKKKNTTRRKWKRKK